MSWEDIIKENNTIRIGNYRITINDSREFMKDLIKELESTLQNKMPVDGESFTEKQKTFMESNRILSRVLGLMADLKDLSEKL